MESGRQRSGYKGINEGLCNHAGNQFRIGQDKPRDGVVALTFNAPLKATFYEPDAQGGRVLHVAGILGRQKKPLHKLILNFLAELNLRRPKVK